MCFMWLIKGKFVHFLNSTLFLRNGLPAVSQNDIILANYGRPKECKGIGFFFCFWPTVMQNGLVLPTIQLQVGVDNKSIIDLNQPQLTAH